MSQVKRQLVIFSAIAASFLLGTIVSEFVARSTRSTSHTDLGRAVEVPVHSVVSSTVDSMPLTIP